VIAPAAYSYAKTRAQLLSRYRPAARRRKWIDTGMSHVDFSMHRPEESRNAENAH
jgi:hypothetical protein